MENTLKFSSVYKSIISLNEITLPSFVVLTGRNGSGKSHLLNAIKNGQVMSSLISDLNNDVRLFDSATIIPTDTGIFHPGQDQTRQAEWFNIIQKHRDDTFPHLQKFAIQQGVPLKNCTSSKMIHSLDIPKLREILIDPTRAEEVDILLKQQVKEYGASVGDHAFNQIGDEAWRKAVPKVKQISPETFLISSQTTFFQNEHFIWGDVDPFQQAFGRVFSKYRELIHNNDLLEKYPPIDDPIRRHLSKSEFISEYGTPPWDFVNQILEECRLDFRVDYPPLHERVSYEPKLHKLSTTVEMRFADLSSGEKVLMSFALCLYNSKESRQAKVFPKLLLLDEVDAPLHPSMTASLLNTIQNVLVRDKNVAVIITTHSPSTVALAPEDSIYSMNPLGPTVDKVSKAFALGLLTTGVPTLSVSFNGRRQIFVESRTDANIYDLLYQRYKGHLNSERSLVFLEVGKKDQSGGEQNAGCHQVIRLVEGLTNGGNQSVLGLVDWDGEREQKNRIHVLSPAVRDGLESLLFDPVLLVATIARENISFTKEKGVLDSEDSYTSIHNWDHTRWQRAVDIIQRLVLNSVPQSSNASVNEPESQFQNAVVEAPVPQSQNGIIVEYMNGMTINVASDYLHLDDHLLEEAIIKSFGFLKPKNSRAGGLMQHIAETVLADHQMLLPRDLLVTFEGLLTNEIA